MRSKPFLDLRGISTKGMSNKRLNASVDDSLFLQVCQDVLLLKHAT